MRKLSSISPATLIGLSISFLALPIIVFIANVIHPGDYTDTVVVIKETTIFMVVGVLLWLLLKQEKQGLISIGLHNKHWGKSLLLALLGAVLCIATIIASASIFQLLGLPLGNSDEGNRYAHISLWTMTLVTIRAGVAEEVFYRGYVMERLHSAGYTRFAYFWIPLIIFGLGHYTQGISGILISFFTGTILAFIYWKWRDLKANIMAHFLVDFLFNVVLPQLIEN